MPKVTILGAGISGLSAAYELARRGVPFVLLEASDRTGGLIRTEHAEGYTVDSGADSILTTKPAALELCDELGLTSRLMATTPPRSAFVHANGTLHALPSPSVFGVPTSREGIERYTLLSRTGREDLLQALAGARNPSATVPDDESVADFFRREFGPETVDKIAQPLLGGIHAGDVEMLSIASVAPKLQSAARSRQLFAPATPSPSTASDGVFRALRGGMGELVRAIEDRLPASSVRLRSRALAIARARAENAGHLNGVSAERSPQAWRVMTSDGGFSSDAVIVAAPAFAASELLRDIEPAVAELCAQITYASTASVAVGWPRERVAHALAGSGFVVAKPYSDLRIAAATWVSSKWQDRAAPGHVLLRAFLGGAVDPEITNRTDEELVSIAVADLTGVLGISGPPEFVRVQRWARAGAQHNVGHAARVAEIDERLGRLPGVFVAGSGFHSIGIPDCITDGRAAAARAAAFLEIRSI